MSIADKLITIAENEQKVYKSGQLATLKDSRYMNGKESGAIVSVNDVTPIEHNVGVKVASKNLLAIDAIIPQDNVYISNGIISQIDSDTYNNPLVKLLFYNNNDYANIIKTTPVQLGIISFVFTKDNTFNRLVFGLNGSVIDTVVSIDLSTFQDGDYVIQSNFTNITQGSVSWQDMQVEVGTTATPYTPFMTDFTGVEVARYGKKLLEEPIIYTASPDGTVKGVKSVSPNMTLIPNNNAVTVECEYLRDIDLYIDNLITNVALTGGE